MRIDARRDIPGAHAMIFASAVVMCVSECVYVCVYVCAGKRQENVAISNNSQPTVFECYEPVDGAVLRPDDAQHGSLAALERAQRLLRRVS